MIFEIVRQVVKEGGVRRTLLSPILEVVWDESVVATLEGLERQLDRLPVDLDSFRRNITEDHSCQLLVSHISRSASPEWNISHHSIQSGVSLTRKSISGAQLEAIRVS